MAFRKWIVGLLQISVFLFIKEAVTICNLGPPIQFSIPGPLDISNGRGKKELQPKPQVLDAGKMKPATSHFGGDRFVCLEKDGSAWASAGLNGTNCQTPDRPRINEIAVHL
jgi:hypothetical protein